MPDSAPPGRLRHGRHTCVWVPPALRRALQRLPGAACPRGAAAAAGPPAPPAPPTLPGAGSGRTSARVAIRSMLACVACLPRLPASWHHPEAPSAPSDGRPCARRCLRLTSSSRSLAVPAGQDIRTSSTSPLHNFCRGAKQRAPHRLPCAPRSMLPRVHPIRAPAVAASAHVLFAPDTSCRTTGMCSPRSVRLSTGALHQQGSAYGRHRSRCPRFHTPA